MLVRQRQEVQALPRRIGANEKLSNQVFDLVAVVGSRERSELCAVVGSRRSAGTIAPAMADEREPSLQEQLEGIGAQLDWVRGYL